MQDTAIDLMYQCQWCDNAAVAEGFCGPCGSKADLCRAPKYSRLRVQFANSLHPEFNQLLTTTSTGCCGVWAGTAPVSSNPYPFLRWGYHRHYRYRSTFRFVNSRQDGVSFFGPYYDEKPVSDYQLFQTGSASAVWHYWHRLGSYSVKMYPVLVYGQCRLRVVVAIVGNHFVSQRVVWRNSDGRPNTGCHVPLFTGISGIEYANYLIATNCLVNNGTVLEAAGQCPGIFSGVNPNAHIMPYRPEQPWEEPNLPTAYTYRQVWCHDFEKIPSIPIPLSVFTGTNCGTGPCETDDSVSNLPSSLAWPTWENTFNPGTAPACFVGSMPGSAFPATAGPSPHPDCGNPISPASRRYIRCESATSLTEAIAGSSPQTTTTPPDFGSWTIQFSQTT
jgi:hypothetical protein